MYKVDVSVSIPVWSGSHEKFNCINTRSEFQLLSLMTKMYLRKALNYNDSQIKGVAPITSGYLASLHFASSEYGEILVLCSSVVIDQTFEEEKETLKAGCLLFIDDIARIAGLCVLKKITNNLHYIGFILIYVFHQKYLFSIYL